MILKEIENILNSISNTAYSNEQDINEEVGEYTTNCSGIIKFLLNKLDVDLEFDRAADLFNYTKENKLECIKSVSDLRPGDLLIWKKNKIPKSGSSGHISVLLEKMNQSEKELEIKVFDCVKYPHDNDKRDLGGVGVGTYRLLLDSEEPCGFIWSTSRKKTKLTEVLMVRNIQQLRKDHFD